MYICSAEIPEKTCVYVWLTLVMVLLKKSVFNETGSRGKMDQLLHFYELIVF